MTGHNYNGSYAGTTHSYTVQAKNFRKVVVDDKLGKNVELLGHGLAPGSAELRLPRNWPALQMGQKLTFSPLALDRARLRAGKKKLPSSEIKAIKTERGTLWIKKDKGWFNWARATVPPISNSFVFFELVGRFAKID